MKTTLIREKGIGFQTIDGHDYHIYLNGNIYHTHPIVSGLMKNYGAGGKLSYKNCYEIFLEYPDSDQCIVEIEMEKFERNSATFESPKLDEKGCLILKDSKKIPSTVIRLKQQEQ